MEITLSNRGLVEFDASAFATAEERKMLYSITKLNLSLNKMTDVRGLQCLSNLTSLDISGNRVTSLRGLPLKLRHLNVANNNLVQLEGLSPLSQLETLIISHNTLKNLRGLPPTPSLRLVNASSNRIESLEGIEPCTTIHELNLSDNLLPTIDSLIPLKYISALRTLSLASNPVTAAGRNAAVAVRRLLPNLSMLDGSPVVNSSSNSNLTSNRSITAALDVSRRRTNRTPSAMNSEVEVSLERSALSANTTLQDRRPVRSELPPTVPAGMNNTTAPSGALASVDSRPRLEDSLLNVSVPTMEVQRLMEHRITQLEKQLATTQSQLKAALGENDSLKDLVTQLRTALSKAAQANAAARGANGSAKPTERARGRQGPAHSDQSSAKAALAASSTNVLRAPPATKIADAHMPARRSPPNPRPQLTARHAVPSHTEVAEASPVSAARLLDSLAAATRRSLSAAPRPTSAPRASSRDKDISAAPYTRPRSASAHDTSTASRNSIIRRSPRRTAAEKNKNVSFGNTTFYSPPQNLK